MSNSHTVPDFASELQATCEDLLPACVISTSWPTVPASSLTLAAFTTQGYVRDLQNLIYVDQPAITLTLPSANGTTWLALTRDVATAYSGWTRRAGSHYMFQLAGSRPLDVDGLLVFASAVVAGAVITAVTPAPGVTRAERWRTLAGLGTMATQDASAVAITGGTAALNTLNVTGGTQLLTYGGSSVAALYSDMAAGGGTNRYFINHTSDAPTQLGGKVGIQRVPAAFAGLSVAHKRAAGEYAVIVTPDADTGNPAVVFYNAAVSIVGSITTTGAATSYNTSSDARLKRNIHELLGGVDAIKRLRPVSYVWNSTDEPDIGFLAHELMTVAPNAVQGLPDDVNPDGTIKPQQVDQSKLIPLLTSAIKELLAQVEALAARVQSLEEQLGV